MDIGEKIKNEREQQQLSREELAEATGKTVDFIGKVERGARKIHVEDLARVAKVLGRPVEFFTGEVEESEAEKEFEAFIESAEIDPRDGAELHRLSRLRTKQAVVNLIKLLDARRFGLFRQKVFETEVEVTLDGGCHKWWHRRIQVLDSKLPELKLRYVINYDLRSTSFAGFAMHLLKERCSRKEGKIEIGPSYLPGNLAFYSIRFEPPLQRGEIADVSCEESYHNAFIMTHDELEQLLREGKSLEEEPKERTAANAVVPTDLLRRRITFPSGYEISDIDVDVFVRRMRINDERERVKKEKCLSHMRIASRWVLELQVRKPIVGAAYHITWRPPSQKDYEKLLPVE